ncbi:MAG: hypothetical protein M1324_02555 [Patescibacteria group bacterium]|nr:hypothetical protein [Patescibacteria group bacterium]
MAIKIGLPAGRYDKKENSFVNLFPRISALTFVLSLFIFLSSDIVKLIDISPLLFNFFFGVTLLAVLVVTWNKNKLSGIMFIILGIIYSLATWNKILAVSVLSTSIWLILTGLLFLITEADKLSAKKLAEKKIHKN